MSVACSAKRALTLNGLPKITSNLFTNKIDFMKKRSVYPQVSAWHLLLVAVFFCCIFIQTSCNNSNAQPGYQVGQKKSTEWTCVDITFKPQTNEEWREKSIRDIEKMLIKSVAPYTKKYNNFYPSIRITKTPFFDTLKYQICVLNTYKVDSELQLLSKAETPCPPCPGYCPSCDTMRLELMSSYYIEKMDFDRQK